MKTEDIYRQTSENFSGARPQCGSAPDSMCRLAFMIMLFFRGRLFNVSPSHKPKV